MANVKMPEGARIVSGGGRITYDTYTGDGSNATFAGDLGYVSAGTVVTAASTGKVLKTDVAPFTGPHQWVMFLEDSDATDDFIPVQLVNADTLFGAYVVDYDGDDVTMATADKGTYCQLYSDGSGVWGVENAVATGIAIIVSVNADEAPWEDSWKLEDSDGVEHSYVTYTLLQSLFA